MACHVPMKAPKLVSPARAGSPSGQTRAVGVGAAAAAGDFGARPGTLQAPIKTRQLVKTNRASGLTQRGKLQQPKRDPPSDCQSSTPVRRAATALSPRREYRRSAATTP